MWIAIIAIVLFALIAATCYICHTHPLVMMLIQHVDCRVISLLEYFGIRVKQNLEPRPCLVTTDEQLKLA